MFACNLPETLRVVHDVTSKKNNIEVTREAEYMLSTWTTEQILETLTFGLRFRVRAAIQTKCQTQAEALLEFSDVVNRLNTGTIGVRKNAAKESERTVAANPLLQIIWELNRVAISKAIAKKINAPYLTNKKGDFYTSDKETQKAFNAEKSGFLLQMAKLEKFSGPAQAEYDRRQALLEDMVGEDDDDLLADLGIE